MASQQTLCLRSSVFSNPNSPSDGTNALADSIRVKQVWAEVLTPLGQLRFGRMPSHFGMGLLANEGRGLDKDFGDSNDRIMFATKIAGHYIVPGFDWSASGPSSVRYGVPQGSHLIETSEMTLINIFWLLLRKINRK